MDENLPIRISVIGYIFWALVVPVIPEPIATDSDNNFLGSYLANRRRHGRIPLVSDVQPPSRIQRTNSARLDELEERLLTLEADYQSIREKNKALERKLSEQEELSQLQRELVSTLKRIVGPVAPSDQQWAEVDRTPDRTPTVDGDERIEPDGDVDNSLPPSVSSTPVADGQDAGLVVGTHSDPIEGSAPGATGQTSSNTPEEDLREVNEYLGNMEAQLVQLNPESDDLVHAAAGDFDRVSSNPSLYGRALLHLDEQNSLLRGNFEEVLRDFEEFKGRVVELLASGGSNKTSSVLQTPEVDGHPQADDRGSFLDDILRDVATPGEDDLTERSINKVSGKVGFSVAASAPQLGIQNQAQIVEFDYVFTNKGDGFRTDNSSFVCGVSGYYYFSFSMRSFDNRYLGVMLMKNNDYQVAIYTDSDERSVMESQSALIHLRRGDAVWLRLAPSSKYGLYSDQYHLTTFSGILVYKGD